MAAFTNGRTDEPRVGIFLQTVFPTPGWYLRDAGTAGWKAQLDWAKATGFNAATFSTHVQHRLDDPNWALAEQRRMYHGMLAPRPPFGPGDVYFEADPLLRTPETKRNVEIRRAAMRYAEEIGMHTVVGLKLNVGAPSFARAHPELQAVTPDDFCNEGMPLCPAKPAAVEHLLDLYGKVVDSFPMASGFSLWGRDSGGCECEVCQSKDNPFLELTQRFYEIIKRKRPDALVYVMSWGYEADEIPPLAASLPRDVISMEPPGIHYPGRRPTEEHASRIAAWRNSGIEAHGWIETQENPTFLLPACYPKRIEEIIRVERAAGIESMWSSSTMNSFVIPLNHYVFARLARDSNVSGAEATKEFLAGTFGGGPLPNALEWANEMEDVYTRLYAPTQRSAFALPLHTVFPVSLFPVPLMHEPASKQLAEDVDATVKAAGRAVTAAESIGAAGGWRDHPLDTNIVIVSTKLVYARAKFRQAKLPVLDAIRRDDLDGAVVAFERVTELAREMVDIAASAPNTQYLNTRWTKLALLPERLAAVRDHLPTLVHMKRIRGLFDDDPLGSYRAARGKRRELGFTPTDSLFERF